jgi:TRAP-type C4-dicarboxylate transport system permease large subunit
MPVKSAPPDGAPPDGPPSLPPLVKYVLAPGAVGALWLAFGAAGFLLALCTWLGWYVYAGYEDATKP